MDDERLHLGDLPSRSRNTRRSGRNDALGSESVRSRNWRALHADRVVERGKMITSAGVSSGIDMGLVLLDRLYGPEVAQIIQLAIEYDPQPPFDAGRPRRRRRRSSTLVRQRIGEGPRSPPPTTGGMR